jgi:hypothetical protein
MPRLHNVSLDSADLSNIALCGADLNHATPVDLERADRLARAEGGAELCDLRRTVATGLQRLGVRLEVTEAVLNHISGSRGRRLSAPRLGE